MGGYLGVLSRGVIWGLIEGGFCRVKGAFCRLFFLSGIHGEGIYRGGVLMEWVLWKGGLSGGGLSTAI